MRSGCARRRLHRSFSDLAREKTRSTSLLRAFEAYQFWMAISGKRGRERNFTELAHRVFITGPKLDEARASVVKLLTKLAPTEDEVLAAVRAAAYPGRIMKFVVSQYEEGMRGDVQIDDVQYEHIMPQTPAAFWHVAAGTQQANEYARLVNNLGNIALLDSRPTSQVAMTIG
jgi:hypothetical protein